MSAVSPNQFTVLEHLAHGPAWKRSFQTVKPLVDDLIGRGFIEPCRPHLGRGRNMLRLTGAGCALLDMKLADVPAERIVTLSLAATKQKPAKHNRTEAASRLLDEIETWCARTKTRETLIGRLLFRHPGFAGLLRLRLTVTEEKEAAVRAFLECNPDGHDGDLPKCHGFGVSRPLRSAKIRLARGPAPVISSPRALVRRDPCPQCGVRGEIGCRHHPLDSLGAVA